MGEFKLISVLGSIYKLIIKLLANRLKISESIDRVISACLTDVA